MVKIIYSLIAMIAVMAALSSGSAIPMWEFLSRTEKMSHLYSMFAQQVSSYCKTNIDMPVAQCKRDLLVFGVDKLEKMSDLYLDAMDPYQRGANDIIWDSMMEGHRSKPSKKSDTTQSPIHEPNGQYQKNPLFDDIDNDHSDNSNSNKNDDKQNEASSASAVYAMGMDNTYSSYNYPTAIEQQFSGHEPQNHLIQEASAATSVHLNYDLPNRRPSYSNSNYLMGPMIIRVRPDGTPVEEDKLKPLPRDDDREAMTIGKEKIPTIQQLVGNVGGYSTSPTIMTNLPFNSNYNGHIFITNYRNSRHH